MIRIGIADDHMLVRQGFKQVFGGGDFQVIGEAVDADGVMALVRSMDMDVLILDMSMPGRSGIELIKQVKTEFPRLPVLVVSMHHEAQYAVRAIKAGAAGYLTKGSAADDLIEAVRRLAGGGPYITPSVAERLALELRDATSVAPHRLLSDREYQIFQMMVAGDSISGIAEELAISSKTVSTYKARILQKMQMDSTAALIHYAIEYELSKPR